ncbi:6-bladed beta-propeller [Membranicola marinus]|uniref:6-bladed beta-propeller n=1 Tax=Membranihabitans marinus TaxID=1227546 RepID=A0A953HRT3_9BACT|nr:6-bladed beta-propeller [Membranihabitans marinus]MBY5960079.1 6-bladed beta-propeller [Membranihabitans marinus]
MKFILNLFILILMCIACESNSDMENKDPGMISISIPAETDGSWNAMEYFSDYQIIPLETTDASLIRRIKKVIVLKEYIIVFDSSGGKIHFFGPQGKYLHSIDVSGDGPGELLGPQDISVNPKEGALLVYDDKNGLITYDLNGQFLTQEKDVFDGVVTTNFFDVLCFERISDRTFLFRREVPGNGGDHQNGKKLYIGDFHLMTDSFLNYSLDNYTNHNTVYTNYFSAYEQGFNYWEIFNDTLYHVDGEKKTLKRKYYLDFGKRSMADLLPHSPLNELLGYLNKNGTKHSGMPRHFVEFEDKLFFNYTYDLTNNNPQVKFAVYAKESERINVFDGIHLPDEGLSFKELQFKITGDKALAVVNPIDLFENENSRTFLENYPDLQQSDNPVLVILSR